MKKTLAKLASPLAVSGLMILALSACSSFKAQRVDEAKADEKAMEITDNWPS